MTPMTVNAYANFDAGRDHLPGGDPAAAVLRSQCRPGGQLRRHRRGDRPRDEPPFRRPGLEIRHPRQSHRLVDAAGRRQVSSASRQSLSSNMTPTSRCPGMHVKGKLTLGENVADLAGCSVAYDAYHRSLGGTAAAGDRRHDRRPALLSRLGAGVAAQLSRGEPSPAAADRSALRPTRSAPTSSATSTPGTRRSASRRARSCTWRRRSACASGRMRA